MKKTFLIFFALLNCVLLSVAVFAADLSGYKTGDADLNGSINIKDATLIQKNVAGLASLEGEALSLADADANGVVNVKDATLIQKFVAGIVMQFPQKEQNTENTTQTVGEVLTAVTEAITVTETASQPDTSEEVIPTQPTTKPSVDSDGYFDQIIRP